MSLIKNTSIYFTINIITKSISFLIVPIYTSLLSPEDFGIKSAMATYASVVLIINTLAIEKSIYRLYWDYPTEEEKKSFLGTIFISILCSSLLTTLLVFVGSGLVGQIFKSIPFYPFFALVTFKIFIQSLFCLPKICLQVKNEARAYSILNLLEIFAELVGGFVFIWYFKNGIEGFFQGSLVGMLIISPIFLYATSKLITFTFSKEVYQKVLRYSLPLIPTAISAWVLNLSDRIFIERFINVKEVGVYSLGYQLGGAMLILTSAFFIAYNPFYFSRANSNSSESAKKELAHINNLFIMTVTVLASVVCLFSQEIIQLFFPEKYYNAAYVLSIISFSNIFSQISGLFNLSFQQSKNTKELFYIVLFSSILNIFLNFFLVSRFSIYGAATATLLSFIFYFLILYKKSQKYYFIPMEWKKFLMLMIFCAVPFYLLSLIPVEGFLSTSIILKGLGTVLLMLFLHVKTDIKLLLTLNKSIK